MLEAYETWWSVPHGVVLPQLQYFAINFNNNSNNELLKDNICDL